MFKGELNRRMGMWLAGIAVSTMLLGGCASMRHRGETKQQHQARLAQEKQSKAQAKAAKAEQERQQKLAAAQRKEQEKQAKAQAKRDREAQARTTEAQKRQAEQAKRDAEVQARKDRDARALAMKQQKATDDQASRERELQQKRDAEQAKRDGEQAKRDAEAQARAAEQAKRDAEVARRKDEAQARKDHDTKAMAMRDDRAHQEKSRTSQMDEDRPLKRDEFTPESRTRLLDRITEVQASKGALFDMLYAYHFDGGQLNGTGRSKLHLMLETAPANMPLVVYLNMAGEDAAMNARRDAVAGFAKASRFSDVTLETKVGLNPDTTEPAAWGLSHLSKADSNPKTEGGSAVSGTSSMGQPGTSTK